MVRAYDPEDSVLLTMSLDDPPAGPLLLMSFDGDDADTRAEAAVRLVGGERLDNSIVEHWWSHRNAAVDEYTKNMSGAGLLGPHAMIDTMEVAGTWTVLRDLYHSMKERLAEHADFVTCHVSHIYPDGACLYFTLGKACSDDADCRVEQRDMVGRGDDRLPRGGRNHQPPPRHRQAAGALASGRARRLLGGPSGDQGGAGSAGHHEPGRAGVGATMSSPYGVLTLVCNLKAGRGGVAKCMPEVERLLAERGLEYEVSSHGGPRSRDLADQGGTRARPPTHRRGRRRWHHPRSGQWTDRG